MFKAEDFETGREAKLPQIPRELFWLCAEHAADRANAIHEERCPYKYQDDAGEVLAAARRGVDPRVAHLFDEGAKQHAELERLRTRVTEIQDSNRKYCADLMQEIVGLKDERDQLRARVTELEAENAELRREHAKIHGMINVSETDNARLREALEWYASPDNYDYHEPWGKCCVLESDCEIGVREPFEGIRSGGKRARAALAGNSKDE